MVDDLIPAEVQQFILKRIDSIAQLEALLILSGSPQEAWSVSAVAQRLYITEPETASLLARLHAEGLLTAQAGEPLAYQYHPNSVELGELVKRVAEIYAQHLVPVTNLIHSKPRTRIQEFADAFKLRKDE